MSPHSDPWSPQELLEHMRFVQNLAVALVRDRNVADDVAQESLLDVFVTDSSARPTSARPRPRSASELRAWLVGVVRNRVRNHYRKEQRRARWEAEAAQNRGCGLDSSDYATEAIQRAEIKQTIVQTVLALDEPYRSTVILRYLDGKTPTEIAKITDTPIATVKTRLQRGLERMRIQLDRSQGGRSSWTAALLPWLPPAAGQGEREVAAAPSDQGRLPDKSRLPSTSPLPDTAGRNVVPWIAAGLLPLIVITGAYLWHAFDSKTTRLARAPNSSTNTPNQFEGTPDTASTHSVPPTPSTRPALESTSEIPAVPTATKATDPPEKQDSSPVRIRVVDQATERPVRLARVGFTVTPAGSGPSAFDFSRDDPPESIEASDAEFTVGNPSRLLSRRPSFLHTDARGEVMVDAPAHSILAIEIEANHYATSQAVHPILESTELLVVRLETGRTLRIARDGAFIGEPITLLLSGPTNWQGILEPQEEERFIEPVASGSYHLIALRGDDPSLVPRYFEQSVALGSSSVMGFESRPSSPNRLRGFRGGIRYRTLEVREDGDDPVSLEQGGTSVTLDLSSPQRSSLEQPEDVVLVTEFGEIASVGRRRQGHFQFDSVPPGCYGIQVFDLAGLISVDSIEVGSEAVTRWVDPSNASLVGELQSVTESRRPLSPAVIAVVQSGKSARTQILGFRREFQVEGLVPGPARVWIGQGQCLQRTNLQLRSGENELSAGQSSETCEVTFEFSGSRRVSEILIGISPTEVSIAESMMPLASNTASVSMPGPPSDFERSSTSRPKPDPAWYLSPGRYRVTMGSADRLPTELEIEVHANGPIALEEPKTLRVSVRVTRDGLPLSNTLLALLRSNSQWAVPVQTDSRGEAELNLAVGSYRLAAQGGEEATLRISETSSSLSVELSPPVESPDSPSNDPAAPPPR